MRGVGCPPASSRSSGSADRHSRDATTGPAMPVADCAAPVRTTHVVMPSLPGDAEFRQGGDEPLAARPVPLGIGSRNWARHSRSRL